MNSIVLINKIKDQLVIQGFRPKDFIAYYCMWSCHICNKNYNILYNIDDMPLDNFTTKKEHYDQSPECKDGIIVETFGTSFRGNRLRFDRFNNDSYYKFLCDLLILLERNIITIPSI